MKSTDQGFTLIELVIVIVILGILAATALPKFFSVNTQAHQAAVAGTGGALGSAVSIVKAAWVASGSSGAVTDLSNFEDTTIDTNANGWPVATDGTLDAAADCVNVWESVLQNPPSVADSGTASDYTAAFAGTTCTYTYNADNAGTRSIAYDTSNGSVDITNP